MFDYNDVFTGIRVCLRSIEFVLRFMVDIAVVAPKSLGMYGCRFAVAHAVFHGRIHSVSSQKRRRERDAGCRDVQHSVLSAAFDIINCNDS